MTEDEALECDIQRLVGHQVIGLGIVPDYDVAMIYFTGDITAYIRCIDGKLEIEVDAPALN